MFAFSDAPLLQPTMRLGHMARIHPFAIRYPISALEKNALHIIAQVCTDHWAVTDKDDARSAVDSVGGANSAQTLASLTVSCATCSATDMRDRLLVRWMPMTGAGRVRRAGAGCEAEPNITVAFAEFDQSVIQRNARSCRWFATLFALRDRSRGRVQILPASSTSTFLIGASAGS